MPTLTSASLRPTYELVEELADAEGSVPEAERFDAAIEELIG